MSSNYFKQAKDKAARAQAIAAENKKKKEEEERKKREEQNANRKRAAQPSSPKKALSKPSADTYNFDGNLKKYSGEQNVSTQNVSSVKLNVPQRKETVIQNKPIPHGTIKAGKNQPVKDVAGGFGKQVLGGFGKWKVGTNKAIYHAVKNIPVVGPEFKKAIDNQEAIYESISNEGSDSVNKHLGNGAGSTFVNSFAQSTGYMIPDVVNTILSGGANKGAKLASIAANTNVTKWLNALKIPKESAPLFLSNFGNAYDNAIKNGANDGQALTSALLNAYPQTVIEHSGGIQDLIKNGGKGGALKSLVASAIDEGKEELFQYPFEEISKLPYADVTPYSNDPNKQAVINPKAQAQAAAIGALGGLAFGGANTVVDGTLKAAGAVTSAVSNKKANQKVSPVSTEQEYTTVEKTVKKPVSTEFEENYKNDGKMIDDLVKKHLSNTYSPDFAEFEAKERQRFNEATGVKAATAVFKPAQKLNVQQKNMVEDCKKLGISVTFVEGTREQTRGTDFNGAYHNGNIYINQSCENPYNVVLGHEVLHRIKDSDSKAYTQLCDIVNSALGENNDFSMLDEYDREEALADIMGDMLADPAKYREVFRQNQNLFQRILGYIRDMVSRLTGKTNGSFINVSEFTASLKDVEGKLTEIYKESVGKTGEFGLDTKYSYNQQNIYDYTKSFAEQVDDYKKGKIPKNDTLLVGSTPEVYKKIGFNALPVTINQKHVDYALNGTKDIDHYIGQTLLSQLPETIKNPIAVMKSQTQPGRVVCLLKFNHNGKQVIAPLEIDGHGTQNSFVIDSNAIVSVFGKKNAVSNLLYNAINDEANGKTSLFFWNKKEALSLLRVPGLQLPNQTPQDGFIHSIREKGANVNTRFENVTQSKQFKRWFGDWENNPKKASKVVNDDGTPKIVYHGTKDFGFTVFDISKSDDKSTLFFTDDDKIASTYSGKEGISKLQDVGKVDYSNKTPNEIAEALNNIQSADDEFMQQKYYHLDKNMLNSIKSDIDKDAYALLDYLENYDFGNEKENVRNTAANLKNKLDNLEYETISTPLYMLLHHSSVFDDVDSAKRFANLEKNVRLVNEVEKSGNTDVIIGEGLDGYSLYVYDINTAKDILTKKASMGIYSVYLDIKNPFVVEGNGHNWNDITYYEVIPEELKKFYKNGLWKHGTTREAAEYAKSHGFDGVIFKNIYDNGGNNSKYGDKITNVYVVFNSNQIKSATDNIGTFDGNNPDIRYSKKNNTDSESTTQSGENTGREVIDEIPKVDSYLRSKRSMFSKIMSDLMNIKHIDIKQTVKPIFNEAWKEYRKNGRLAPDTVDKMFETVFQNGQIINDEYYNKYKFLKDEIRNTKFKVNNDIKSEITDYSDFRRKNLRTFGVYENGIDIDVKYSELSQRYPELFPDDIYSQGEQLEKIAEVANGIKISEENMADFADTQYGKDYKEYMRDEFKKQFYKVEKEFQNAYRLVQESNLKNSNTESSKATVDDIKKLYSLRKEARRNEKRAKNLEAFTDLDNDMLRRVVNGDVDVDTLDSNNFNVDGIKRVLEYSKAVNDIENEIANYKRGIANERISRAEKFIEGSDNWKSVDGNFFMSLNTMERNLRKIIPDSKSADELIKAYIRPVSKSAADRVRYNDKMREKVKSLGLTKDESYAVQFLGERRAELESLQNKSRLSEQDIKRIDELNNLLSEFKSKYGQYDNEKVNNAISVFRSLYNQIFEDMNNALIKNGYDPVEYRKFYFPHFTDDGDSILTKMGKLVGINSNISELPGDLTGRTRNFKPGKTFFANSLQREGDFTAYDALTGFDKYIEGASDVIFQTENIRNLRALTEALRSKYSKPGIKKRVDEIRKSNIAPEEKQVLIDTLYAENGALSKQNALINELNEYTNLVANKRSVYDRNWEENWGRSKIYNAAKFFQKNIAANLVQYNLSSAASNTVALQQASAEINAIDFLHGFYDTVKAIIKDDGFIDKSDFLTNRKGSDRVSRSGYEKFTDATDTMQFSDMFVSSIVVRARYYENMRKRGMNEYAAVQEADSYANSVIAGRAKGETPTRFAARNPLTKSYTSFQLEVANQLHNIFIDAPKRVLKDGGAWGLAKYITKYLFGAYLYNEIYERIFGRRMALDPLGLIEEAYEDFSGYKLPKTPSQLKGNKDDLYIGKNSTYSAILATADNVLEQVPFFGSLLGGGRIPFAIAKPEFKNVYEAVSSINKGEGNKNKNIGVILSDGVLPLSYALNPFGGLNQLQKTVKGVITVNNGVATNSKGNVLYAVDKNAGNYAKAALFGKSALSAARQYYDTDGKPFSDKETEEYLSRVQNGETNLKVYLDINGRRKAKNTAERLNPFIGKSAQTGGEGIYKELGRLNSSGIDVSFEVPENEVEYNGETYKLSAVNYSRFVRESAQTAEKEVKSLMSTPYYRQCTDEDRQELIREVYSYSKAAAKANVSNYKLSNEYEKIKLAADEGISAGEFISFKKQLGKNKGVENVMKLSNQYGYGSGKTNNMINLVTLSADEYKRISDAGGFKDSYLTYRIYNEAKKAGVECKTCFVPVAEKDFSYTDKSAKIKYRATLSEKQMKELQKIYIVYYEKAIEQLKSMNFSSKADLYYKTQKLRSSAMKAAKRDYCYYLLKHK